MRSMRLCAAFVVLVAGVRSEVRGIEPDLEFASHVVFRLDAPNSSGNTSEGTATLLCASQQADVAYFATCYHVLHKATAVNVQRIKRRSWQEFLTKDNCLFHLFPKWDLVIFSTRFANLQNAGIEAHGVLKNADACNLAWLREHEKEVVFDWLEARRHAGQVNDIVPSPGVAYGIPGLYRGTILPVSIGVWGSERDINLAAPSGRDDSTKQLRFVFDADRLNKESPLYFSYLNNQITLPGMSGGAVVVGDQAQFAGLVFGRLPDTQGVMISGTNVVRALEQFQGKPFDERDFEEPPAVSKEVAQYNQQAFDISEMTARGLSHWLVAFGDSDEHVELFRQFLEVRRDLSLYGDIKDTNWQVQELLEPDQTELLLNSVRLPEFAKTNPSRLALSPGENLLVVRKHKARQGAILNDLLTNGNPLSIRLQEVSGQGPNGKAVFEMKRELPALIESYSVYLTLINGQPPANCKLGDGSAMVSDAPLPDLWQQRLASVDLGWRTAIEDVRTGSQFAAEIALRSPKEIRYRLVSAQTIDFMLPLKVQVQAMALRAGGLVIAPKFMAPFELNLWFRLQVVQRKDGSPWICLRAITGSSQTPINLPLVSGGDGLSVELDVRTLGAQLLVSYLNRALLKPDQMGDKDISAFVAFATGLNQSGEEWVVPALLGFQRDERMQDPKLKITQLTLHGDAKGHFKFHGQGEISAGKCMLGDCTLTDVGLTFDLALDTSIREGRFGTVAVKLTGGKINCGNLDLEITPCQFEFELDERGDIANKVEKLLAIKQSILAGCPQDNKNRESP